MCSIFTPYFSKVIHVYHQSLVHTCTQGSGGRDRDARSPSDPDDDKRRGVIMKLYTGDPPQAKRLWKNAVEQHTFFRLSEPEPPSILTTLFRRGTSFRFSGRTYRQTLRAKSDASKTDKYVKPEQRFIIAKEVCTVEKSIM